MPELGKKSLKTVTSRFRAESARNLHEGVNKEKFLSGRNLFWQNSDCHIFSLVPVPVTVPVPACLSAMADHEKAKPKKLPTFENEDK